MVKVFSLLQDALLVRSSPVLQLIQQSTRKVTSLSPNIRPVLPTALVSQHRPLSTPSTDHVTGHVRDHPLYAVQTTCYHSDVRTRRGSLKQSHQLRYLHVHLYFWNTYIIHALYIYHLVYLHFRARGDTTRSISLVALRVGKYIYTPLSPGY